jgi:hypothetical protein
MRAMTLAIALTCASAAIGVADASSDGAQGPSVLPMPTVYRVGPQAGCVGAASRPDPPRPGVTATALTKNRVRVTWWFKSLPTSCRPSSLALAIDAYTDKKSLTWVQRVAFTGAMSGQTVLTYPSFNRSRPDVALGAAEMADGRRSEIARVLIRQ